MTHPNTPAPAPQEADQANPLSDEYVNAVIQRHGYDSPESVIAQLHQWIGLNGGEDSVTLLMYEAHKALSKLRAPVADSTLPLEKALHELVSKIAPGLDTGDLLQDAQRASAMLDAIQARAALASAPVAGEAQCSCPSGDGSLRWPCAAHAAREGIGRLKQLAAALGNRDWKWWDSCSLRRLTFEDGPQRRDGSALHATVQASDGHPDVNMAHGVREFIEAASPHAVGQLTDQAVRLAAQLRECAETLGADQIDEQRAMRAYADAKALLSEMAHL